MTASVIGDAGMSDGGAKITSFPDRILWAPKFDMTDKYNGVRLCCTVIVDPSSLNHLDRREVY